jgi:hypothetical protein
MVARHWFLWYLGVMPTKPKNHKRLRRLALIDIENLAASPILTFSQVNSIHDAIKLVYPLQPRDLVYVGGHYGNALACDFFARLNHGSTCLLNGPDGADKALIRRAIEIPEGSFNSDIHPVKELLIGSGDHIFADTALQMKQRGISVTVLSRQECLSKKLAEVANRVILLNTKSVDPQVLAA